MKLTFQEKISDGAFADIWRARDELDRELAVKIVREASVGISNALSHAKALARARHPNVVVVHSIEQVDAPEGEGIVDCVVMELLVGETLEARLSRSVLVVSEVERIGQGLLDAVAHIHSQGMIHGDLHEQNVMVVNGDAKVIDLLHRHSLAILSGSRREQEVQRELLMLQLMLQQLLSKSDIARERVIEFGEKTRGNLSLSRLGDTFLSAVSDSEPELLLLTYRKTPRNLLDIITPGMHQENVRSLLGAPSYVDLNRWVFQFRDTQAEVIFENGEPKVSAVILALVHGNIYRGTNPSAHVELPLGEMSFADVMEHYPETIEYFTSLRTKEVYLQGRWGPPGGWTYYAFGALHVFSGIGMLQDVDFEWNETTNQLVTDPKQLRPNWMAVTSFTADVLGFNWYITRYV
jgi:serine/threonine protein kinase